MIPKNSIAIKSTSGGEYVELRTNTPYKGYYYEYKNKIYAGKEFVVSGSVELVGVNDTNKLLNNSSTSMYSFASGLTSQALPPINIPSIPSSVPNPSHFFNSLTNSSRFYYKKYNDNIIKEIDEETYISLQNSPIYSITYIGNYRNNYQTLEIANQQLPGLELFLSEAYVNPDEI